MTESEASMSSAQRDEHEDNTITVAANSRCSSGFASEFGNAAELREAVEFILSKCFSYLRLDTFVKAFPHIKDQVYLEKLHHNSITALRDFMIETMNELYHKTGINSSLNDLHVMIENQPVTFKEVWRPSGDPYDDIEDHLQASCEKYQAKFSALLDSVKQENARKEAEIKRMEGKIHNLRSEIKTACDSINKKAADSGS